MNLRNSSKIVSKLPYNNFIFLQYRQYITLTFGANSQLYLDQTELFNQECLFYLSIPDSFQLDRIQFHPLLGNLAIIV